MRAILNALALPTTPPMAPRSHSPPVRAYAPPKYFRPFRLARGASPNSTSPHSQTQTVHLLCTRPKNSRNFARIVDYCLCHIAIGRRGARKLVRPDTETSTATSAAYTDTAGATTTGALREPLSDEDKALLAERLPPVSRL